jgi:hypothetical protein
VSFLHGVEETRRVHESIGASVIFDFSAELVVFLINFVGDASRVVLIVKVDIS